jgi:hypothetical protein
MSLEVFGARGIAVSGDSHFGLLSLVDAIIYATTLILEVAVNVHRKISTD